MTKMKFELINKNRLETFVEFSKKSDIFTRLGKGDVLMGMMVELHILVVVICRDGF